MVHSLLDIILHGLNHCVVNWFNWSTMTFLIAMNSNRNESLLGGLKPFDKDWLINQPSQISKIGKPMFKITNKIVVEAILKMTWCTCWSTRAGVYESFRLSWSKMIAMTCISNRLTTDHRIKHRLTQLTQLLVPLGIPWGPTLGTLTTESTRPSKSPQGTAPKERESTLRRSLSPWTWLRCATGEWQRWLFTQLGGYETHGDPWRYGKLPGGFLIQVVANDEVWRMMRGQWREMDFGWVTLEWISGGWMDFQGYPRSTNGYSHANSWTRNWSWDVDSWGTKARTDPQQKPDLVPFPGGLAAILLHHEPSLLLHQVCNNHH